MNLKLVFDRKEGDLAVLISEDGQNVINWPYSMLPVEAKEGEILNFNIHDEEEKTKDKKELAKEILNEILNEKHVDKDTSP